MPSFDDDHGADRTHPSIDAGLLPAHAIAGRDDGHSAKVLDDIRRVAAGDTILARSTKFDQAMCALLNADDGEPVSQWRERMRIGGRILDAVMSGRTPTSEIGAALDDRIDRHRSVQISLLTVRLISHIGLDPARTLALLTAIPTLTIRPRDGEAAWAVVPREDPPNPFTLRTMVSPMSGVVFIDGVFVQIHPLPQTIRIALAGMALRDMVSHPAIDPMNMSITSTSEVKDVDFGTGADLKTHTVLRIAPRPTIAMGDLRHSA